MIKKSKFSTAIFNINVNVINRQGILLCMK